MALTYTASMRQKTKGPHKSPNSLN